MVKITPPTPHPDRNNGLRWLRWLFPIAITGFILYFSLPSFIEIDDEGNYVLSKERLEDTYEKIGRSEQVEVYQLVATVPGLYQCLNCPGIKSVRLNLGEVWKYGISRNGKARYSKGYYEFHKVEYIPRKKTDILTAEQLEIELITAYPLLPEAQVRMKTHGIFLKRPPGNAKDR